VNTIARLEPTSLDDAARMVRESTAAGLGVLPVGGATRMSPAASWASGGRERIELRTRGLDKLIDLSPGDLTVSVEAGMTIAALETLLAPHGIRVPLDPPLADGRATVGGMLATNDSGPLQHSLGTARDFVIGMSILLADGTVIKAGGNVVKNVAGYDLHRLMVGSYGSLGLIAQVNFKLMPRPEAIRLLLLAPQSFAQADTWTERLLSDRVRPALIDWLHPAPAEWNARAAANGEGPLLVVGFEGLREDVDGQVAWVEREFRGAAALDAEASRARYELLRMRCIEAAQVRFRASVPSSRVAMSLQLLPPGVRVHVHAGAGVIHGSLKEWNGTQAAAGDPRATGASGDREASALLREFAEYVQRCRGWMKVQHADGCPMIVRSVSNAVGGLERRLKQRLDPGGVFPNPPFLS